MMGSSLSRKTQPPFSISYIYIYPIFLNSEASIQKKEKHSLLVLVMCAELSWPHLSPTPKILGGQGINSCRPRTPLSSISHSKIRFYSSRLLYCHLSGSLLQPSSPSLVPRLHLDGGTLSYSAQYLGLERIVARYLHYIQLQHAFIYLYEDALTVGKNKSHCPPPSFFLWG